MKRLYLVGGTMGVGKTTVCNILKKELPACVFLDGDWCWDLHPFRVTPATMAMVMDNIHAVLGNFLKCEEIENVIFCWVMHQQEIVEDVLSGLPLDGVEVIRVSLTCTPECLRGRLEGDIAAGIRQRDILERSMARLELYQSLSGTLIDTTGKTPMQIAHIIRQEGEK